MKILVSALVGAALITGALGVVLPASATGGALFTSAQALAGAKAYDTKCSRCHGANLEGVSAPALRGSGSGLAGNSLSEAFTFISTQMPAGDPASLTTTEYTNIVAYILQRNGHAAGPAALTPTIAKHSHLKVSYSPRAADGRVVTASARRARAS